MSKTQQSPINSVRMKVKWLLKRFRIENTVNAADAPPDMIQNLKVLLPGKDDVPFGVSERDKKFLSVCKYFAKGVYSRPDIFVCEVPRANYHVGTGLICTSDFRIVNESVMEYRVPICSVFQRLKPVRLRYLPGTYSTIYNLFSYQWWHWTVDCLPRIYSLHKAYPGQKIVLLMPDDMGPTFDQSLACALPSNFHVQYVPRNSWIKVDRMLLPSYVSGRSNGHVPFEHYDFVRRTVFASLGLPQVHQPTDRIYLSRAHTKYRRVLNEPQLITLLERYGFKTVVPEKLSFSEQVALFHQAEVIVSAHGSGWGNLIFAGKIKILVLYPECTPNTHIFTMAKALEQEHYFVSGPAQSLYSASDYPDTSKMFTFDSSAEDADFVVDLADVETVLRDEMGLTPNLH